MNHSMRVSKRKRILRKILSCLAVLTLTATAIFFPSALPAFAINPPFPAVYWLHQEVSTIIPTNSWQLKDVDMDQAENTTTSVKPGKSQLEFQWRPGVSNYGTFGKTTVGGSSQQRGGDHTVVSKFTAPEAGDITSITVYFNSPVPPSANVVLYSDSAGSPNALLRNAAIATPAAGWNTATITSYTMAAGEVLWLGFSIPDEDSGDAYDAGATNQYAENRSYLANPFGTPTFNARVLSAYATYTRVTTGYGWVFDSPLNGKYDASQIWTFYVRLRLSGGTAPTGTVRAYVYRYDGASTYTPLFTAQSASITPSSTATTYSFTYTPASDLDMQGQYLYVHYTWQTSSGGNADTSVAFHVEGTGLAAADRARIVAGSSSIPTLGYPLLILLVLFLVYTLLRKGVLRTRRVMA